MTRRWVAAVVLLLLPGALWAAALEVSVQERAKVGQAQVTLGSIAEVSGGDDGLAAKARGVTVHRFGSDESAWRVSGRAVSQALWDAGIGLDQVNLDIPLGAKVVRGTVRLDGERVAQAVTDHLSRGAGEGVRVQVDFPQGPPTIDGLPAKGRIDVAREAEGQVRVRVSVDGEVVASRSVPVTVKQERRVVVAAENLRPGSRIESDQVEVTYHEGSGGDRWSVLTAKAEAVGSWVLKAVAQGQPVKRSHLRLSPDVRAGDPVTLIYGNGKMRITAPGTVRQQGAIGEVLAMENRSSGKEVYARLVGPNKAQVVKRGAGGDK